MPSAMPGALRDNSNSPGQAPCQGTFLERPMVCTCGAGTYCVHTEGSAGSKRTLGAGAVHAAHAGPSRCRACLSTCCVPHPRPAPPLSVSLLGACCTPGLYPGSHSKTAAPMFLEPAVPGPRSGSLPTASSPYLLRADCAARSVLQPTLPLLCAAQYAEGFVGHQLAISCVLGTDMRPVLALGTRCPLSHGALHGFKVSPAVSGCSAPRELSTHRPVLAPPRVTGGEAWADRSPVLGSLLSLVCLLGAAPLPLVLGWGAGDWTQHLCTEPPPGPFTFCSEVGAL